MADEEDDDEETDSESSGKEDSDTDLFENFSDTEQKASLHKRVSLFLNLRILRWFEEKTGSFIFSEKILGLT